MPQDTAYPTLDACPFWYHCSFLRPSRGNRRILGFDRFHSHFWRFIMAKTPMRVAITGAAGQIGYSLLFRIANGDMLGKDQPVILQLLEIDNEKAQKALKGVMMEID